ncbi:MAG: hypothetical protein LUI02_02380 [Clostridiales bacterium]|nr:hypothetical protein [Clostridiales bacterium]
METSTQTLKIGRLTCNCTSAGSRRITYMITPMPLVKGPIKTFAARYGTNIVVVHGLDWDDDMTPWPAPGVMHKDADFKGLAAEFLTVLRNSVIPEAERLPGMDASDGRDLIGISLSGLFALWAWMQGEDFADIACVSGSFWYDGFADWLCNEGLRPKSGLAYFSLGDLEGNAKDHPRFRTVRQATSQIIDALNRHGIHTLFQQNAGTHYAPFFPRLEKAFAALSSPCNYDKVNVF